MREPRVALPGAGTQGPDLGLLERARDLAVVGTARRLDRGRLLAVPLVAEFCRGVGGGGTWNISK